VNDTAEDARRLSRLLRGIRSKINLIPFNPHPGSRFERPAQVEIEAFQNLLHAEGYQINVRRPRGDDIQAACGQLMAASSESVSSEQSGRRGTPHASRLTPHAWGG
jgi:23S rRNA (adenine2503-C2)-methyltransferase